MKEIYINEMVYEPKQETVIREICGQKFLGFITGSIDRVFAFKTNNKLESGDDISFNYNNIEYKIDNIELYDSGNKEIYLLECRNWTQNF